MGWFDRKFGKKPAAPSKVFMRFNGLIRVSDPPDGPGWQWLEDERHGADFQVQEIKFRLAGEPMPMMLYAKVVSLANGNGETMETLRSRDWRKELAGLFGSVDKIETSEIKHALLRESVEGIEVRVDGTHAPSGAPLRLRERRIPGWNALYVITAVGPVPAFQAALRDVERWFASVVFEG
jgi:hypothetical protein